MNAPQGRVSPEQWQKDFERERNSKYYKRGIDWLCKICHEAIYETTCIIQVHKGNGICQTTADSFAFPIPFCDSCEGEPISKKSCVHI